MTVKNREIWWKSSIWLTLALIAICILALRLQLSFDLSLFFPQKTSLMHEVLLEQLKSGPGSRLLVIGINGRDQGELADISDQMRRQLAASPAFVNVLNGENADEEAIVPEPVASYYLLMGNIDYSEASLQGVFQLRLQDLAFGGGSELLDLIARDPFLLTLEVLQRLMPVAMKGDMWFAADGSAVLLAETRATAVDLAAQTEAMRTVGDVFSKIAGSAPLDLEVTGVGAFGVELQGIIRAEAKKRSILAACALFLVLLIVYRSPRFLLLATVPLGMGFLAGLALVSLVFDSVHGITLAFGFTLLGIALDYPIHVFSHSRQGQGGAVVKRIWPTMRLGAASTVIAYLALILAGSRGLAQLGVFTASGVTVAALVTRTWLPSLMRQEPGPPGVDSAGPRQPALAYLPAVVALGLALLAGHYVSTGGLWDDNLSSLSPVPDSRLQTDGLLRSAAGTPDMRYQLVLSATSLETLLLESESVDRLLEDAVKDGLLDGWQSVSQVLPSQQLQQLRQAAIPDSGTLRNRLNTVLAGSPFRREAFTPFEANSRAAKSLAPLMPSHFRNTSLASWLNLHLVELQGQWISLVSLSRPRPAELAERVATWGKDAELVDIQQSSGSLLRDYRNGATRTIAIASLIIVVLLVLQIRKARTTLWIALTVAAALAVTITLVTILHGKLNVIHLVALLLVLGLGLDYSLFLSRSESATERRVTQQAVLVCAVSTGVAFGVLAGSSIPVLKFLGFTVAIGSIASVSLAFLGSLSRRGKVG